MAPVGGVEKDSTRRHQGGTKTRRPSTLLIEVGERRRLAWSAVELPPSRSALRRAKSCFRRRQGFRLRPPASARHVGATCRRAKSSYRVTSRHWLCQTPALRIRRFATERGKEQKEHGRLSDDPARSQLAPGKALSAAARLDRLGRVRSDAGCSRVYLPPAPWPAQRSTASRSACRRRGCRR
jgi:hypothetical protein